VVEKPEDNRGRRDTRLLLELGRGGMGVVYLALAQGAAGFSKLKVIKRLRPDIAEEPRAVQMFLDEARISARLLHPNVVQTNEAGFDGKHYFLEMEYLEGQSYDALTRRAAKSGGLPLAVSIWILIETLAGLHYAHGLTDLDGTVLHVVHRDVSPHNVFVTYDGNVKVLDFGIAKAADSSGDTSTGGIKGKATYMAPEQAARRPVDHRADIFAVGVMLWQAITGTRLWGDANDFEIFLKLQSEPIPSPRTARADVSPELEAICMRALAAKPEDRYATAAELQAALEEHLEATGARVGQRQLAKLMVEWFAAKRASVKAEIEAQIKNESPKERTVEIPALGDRDAGASTASIGIANTIGERSGDSATQRRYEGQARTLRRMTLAALGAAVVAGGVIAAVFAMRGKSKPSAPAASATVASLPRECEKNVQCIKSHEGKPWICRKDDGKCVSLESEDCKILAEPGDVENDRTIWFGAMFPTTGPKAEYGALYLNGVDLGRRDFMQIARGIPSREGELPARPLAILACDDAVEPLRPARHLADDVRVPAVIGFGSSQEVIDLTASVFAPRRVLVVPSVNMSALITGIPTPRGAPRLVWRTTLSDDQWGLPASVFVPDVLEPRLRGALVVGGNRPVKVALIRSNTTSSMSLADKLFANMRFNGKSVLENGDDFGQFVYGDPANAQQVVSAIVKFKPHVVVFLGFFETSILEPIESMLKRSGTQAPYFVSAGSLPQSGDDFFRFIGKNSDRRQRFFGVATPATTIANAKLTLRYNETFPTQTTTNDSPAGAYDALYLLGYAAYLNADDSPLSGSKLARAIPRLIPPGPSLEVGPTRIFEVMNLLRSGANVDLTGANSRLDFDVSTGEALGDFVIQCIGVDTEGRAVGAIESGLFYDSITKKLSGTLARCR
jgi:ABC-type branched-subunit amino acid transport system substrate-binding protein